jgi:hypothetical protein
MKVWSVHGSMPPPPGKSGAWRQNWQSCVAAETLEECAARVRKEHPEITIHSIHHHGELLQ